MNTVPFLLHCAEAVSVKRQSPVDPVTFEDELPAVLNRNGQGYILARDSHLTEVNQETTDDN